MTNIFVNYVFYVKRISSALLCNISIIEGSICGKLSWYRSSNPESHGSAVLLSTTELWSLLVSWSVLACPPPLNLFPGRAAQSARAPSTIIKILAIELETLNSIASIYTGLTRGDWPFFFSCLFEYFTLTGCPSKMDRISWLWHYIHYLSFPMHTISWSEPFSRHTLYY